MKCPVCHSETTVTDSRPKNTHVYRRRVCNVCGTRCTTQETIVTGIRRGPKATAPASKPVRTIGKTRQPHQPHQTQQTQRHREVPDYEPFDTTDDLRELGIDFSTDID